jgi:hypothetical protein
MLSASVEYRVTLSPSVQDPMLHGVVLCIFYVKPCDLEETRNTLTKSDTLRGVMIKATSRADREAQLGKTPRGVTPHPRPAPGSSASSKPRGKPDRTPRSAALSALQLSYGPQFIFACIFLDEAYHHCK